MKKAVLLMLVAIGVGILLWLRLPMNVSTDSSIPAEAPDAREIATTKTIRLDVGLSDDEAALWHHHDEGSGFLPLSFFHALVDSVTGTPFIEALPRFGFVPNPNNAYGLPIGMSAAPLAGAPTKSVLVGVTCAACHSGQFTYQGTAMTIDGAPNMLDFEALLNGLEADLEATLASPRKTLAFLHDLMAWEKRLGDEEKLVGLHPEAVDLVGQAVGGDHDHPLATMRQHLASSLHEAYHAETPDHAAARLASAANDLEDASPEEQTGTSAWQRLREALPKMHHDLAFIRRRVARLVTLSKAFGNETAGGPGRADSFNAIWDLLVQQDDLTALNAPVSIPHLYAYATFEWVHWDGNSSAVMGRDYAQAIALGADFVRSTGVSTVLPHNVVALERTAHKFTSPTWPAEVLGTIDTMRATRGEELYGEHCLSCHGEETLTPLEEIGTDPGRAEHFAELNQDGKSYAELLIEFGEAVAQPSLDAGGVTAAELAPILRSPNPTWRVTRAYHARALTGIWASPPYLHNGSVPTLWDLLQPADLRPQTFQVGRELDARKVGIDTEGQGAGAWIFRADVEGNANSGHAYGLDLSDEDKWALVEYMKTL